ncbi:hypothetical protein EUTSA_v10028270mg [Eutrema salsugineum]|uniref:RING-type E3 ubiquitin transferase n=1 Tax=Eutrema salsugineum TaxID=72664 RepID=V4M4Q6_EUTSA|nr:E3 ubiquitin-protein ligase SINA-like 7 [Eutrema salsugineum]ESQ47268.1 hypothetical protein EUTSA_v10028270mg [Eutrema salsugineum]
MANQISLSSESSSGENDDTNYSAKLLDLEALNCPICRDPLTTSIYQCDSGHIACSICCEELGNICPYCDFPIGQIHCSAMERVLQSVLVPCPNAKLGCTKSFSYGTELTHKRECIFSRCYCPAENCDYSGSYKDLYSHFGIHKGRGRYNYLFLFDQPAEIYFELSEYTSVVMKENKNGLLFVVHCFREPHGIYVTVNFIAPSAVEVGDFSCHISSLVKNYYMVFVLPKIKGIRKMSFETPKEDFMLVPSYFLRGSQALKLKMLVKKLNQG